MQHVDGEKNSVSERCGRDLPDGTENGQQGKNQQKRNRHTIAVAVDLALPNPKHSDGVLKLVNEVLEGVDFIWESLHDLEGKESDESEGKKPEECVLNGREQFAQH